MDMYVDGNSRVGYDGQTEKELIVGWYTFSLSHVKTKSMSTSETQHEQNHETIGYHFK